MGGGYQPSRAMVTAERKKGKMQVEDVEVEDVEDDTIGVRKLEVAASLC